MSERPALPLAERDFARHPGDGWLAAPQRLWPVTERALRGVIRALLPGPPAPQPTGLEDALVAHVGMMLQYMPRPAQLGFRLLLHLLDWSPLWRLRALRTLKHLPRERASAVLDGLATSPALPVRMLTLAPKAIILSGYFDRDEVHAALDYAPRPFLAERVALRQRLEAEAPPPGRELRP